MLLVNACQAAQKEVQVRVGQDDQRAESNGPSTDDGPGANDEQLSWLTEPFSTTHFAQFGLGLALRAGSWNCTAAPCRRATGRKAASASS